MTEPRDEVRVEIRWRGERFGMAASTDTMLGGNRGYRDARRMHEEVLRKIADQMLGELWPLTWHDWRWFAPVPNVPTLRECRRCGYRPPDGAPMRSEELEFPSCEEWEHRKD